MPAEHETRCETPDSSTVSAAGIQLRDSPSFPEPVARPTVWWRITLMRTMARHQDLQRHKPGYFQRQFFLVFLIFAMFVVALVSSDSAPVDFHADLACIRPTPTPTPLPVKSRLFRVFDLFLYHNEAFMLYIRLRTLREFVDLHYIGYSLSSFSLRVITPLSFAPFESEIHEFDSRCRWLNYTFPADNPTGIAREESLHTALIELVEAREHPAPNDLIIWSDVDEIPLPSGLAWLLDHPPRHYYRFSGHFFFYNLRWRSADRWEWAFVIRYGGKIPEKRWSGYRPPDKPPFEWVGGESKPVSLFHCSYCFPSLGLIIQKLKSSIHPQFAQGKWVNPNYIYARMFCGYDLIASRLLPIDYELLGLGVPDGDPRFDFLKRKLSLNDLETTKFDVKALKENAPCPLPFLVNKTEVSALPDHIP
jgi:hypothetical protein